MDAWPAWHVEMRSALRWNSCRALIARNEVTGSGYSVASLETALWCFAHSGDFESAILAAANLGNDADTTAAIAGQLAGAYYGVRQIPAPWMERLHMRDEIESMASALFRAAERH